MIETDVSVHLAQLIITLIMAQCAPKRRFPSLIFLVSCISKSFLIRVKEMNCKLMTKIQYQLTCVNYLIFMTPLAQCSDCFHLPEEIAFLFLCLFLSWKFIDRIPHSICTDNCTSEIVLQVFQAARENLQNIMDGYCIGEPHFSRRLEEDVNTLMKALKDPALPLLELQVRYH